jgi:non-specific serine/threonine protein kinase
MLTGSMAASDRDHSVKQFQQDPGVQVFLLSVKAGGTGLNLTSADYVVLLDPWWNPFAEKQAIARAHRIGRTKNVFVTRFISTSTIEEKILALQARKTQLSGDLIDVDELSGLSEDDLDSLLEE